MTAYIIAPEQHAQIIKALNIGIAKHYDLAQDVRIGDALAMLKSMKPVTPACYGWRGNDGVVRDCIAPDTHQIIEGQYNVPLYAKEQQ